MKTLLTLLTITTLLLTSCQDNINSDSTEILDSIQYVKDTRTGLCFATVSSMTHSLYVVTSITCVPCDSLKRVDVE